jgi:myo-inositol 2-dehydrogenase/D-chiro-inositol 1-dehydrogenase
MINIIIFGAGRIGQVHAANVAVNPRAKLVSIVDVNQAAAADLAGKYGARAETDVEAPARAAAKRSSAKSPSISISAG